METAGKKKQAPSRLGPLRYAAIPQKHIGCLVLLTYTTTDIPHAWVAWYLIPETAQTTLVCGISYQQSHANTNEHRSFLVGYACSSWERWCLMTGACQEEVGACIIVYMTAMIRTSARMTFAIAAPSCMCKAVCQEVNRSSLYRKPPTPEISKSPQPSRIAFK